MSEAKPKEIQLLERAKDFCSIGLFTFVIILCTFTYFWIHQTNNTESSAPSTEILESKHNSVGYKKANQSAD